MYKEIIIGIIIVLLVFVGDWITQNYTRESISILTEEMQKLKIALEEQSNEKTKSEIESIDKNWEKMHDKLSYYIEHNELEKVETNFTSCKSLANSANYDLAINELEKTIFILDHITDKYAFSLQNIF